MNTSQYALPARLLPRLQRVRGMTNRIVRVLAGAVVAVFATPAWSAEPTQVERIQAALDAWLVARAPIERVTGIAAYISFGATEPAS